MDYMIRAISENEHIRAFFVTSKELVEKARKVHNTSPNVTAALGRVLTAASMMSFMQKEDDAVLSISIKGDGNIKGITVSAYEKGVVKGFPFVKRLPLLEKRKGKLDIASCVGKGTMTVIKDLGEREPYSSQINLVSGEIAEDFTYYFAESEQVPSAVGLGVLVEKDESVSEAGGFIIQLMPDATEEDIQIIENGLKNFDSVTDHLKNGGTPYTLLELLLKGANCKVLDKRAVRFSCNCSRDRVEKALLSIGKKDLYEILSDKKPITLKCEYCNTTYEFKNDEIKELLKY